MAIQAWQYTIYTFQSYEITKHDNKFDLCAVYANKK